MTDTTVLTRPVPRWLHAWAVLLALMTLLLLAIGQMVTSFRAGMADPLWPTEPWYLADNYKLDFNYLIEHTHRIVAFSVGGLAIVLALGLWWTDPKVVTRYAGVIGLIIVIAAYGQFHRLLWAQKDVPTKDVVWPVNEAQFAGGAALGVILLGLLNVACGVRGATVRLLGAVALIAVMIQGLFGGFRVKLNELVGTDLAAVHGVFGVMVFSLLVAISVLTGRPGASSAQRANGSLVRWSVALTVLLIVQVIWGAMVRHDPIPLTQRLHFLTAFAATAVAVWVLRAAFTDLAARNRAGWTVWAMVLLLIVQLYLGVEAWLAKFGTYTLPELVEITPQDAAIRTLHALVGSMLLAVSVAMTLRLGRTASLAPGSLVSGEVEWSEPRARERAEPVEVLNRVPGNSR